MTAFESIFSQEIVQRLGWTLLHFVWQAAAVALLLAVLLAVLRRASANLRYAVACLALGLIVLLPVVTMQLVRVSVYKQPVTPPVTPTPVIMPAKQVSDLSTIEPPPVESSVPAEKTVSAPATPRWQRVSEKLEPALPHVVSAWLIGVLALSVWHLGGWTQLQRLRRKMVKPVDASLRAKLEDMAGRLGIRRAIQLTESALVQIPTVVGWLRPVILLPASALTGLTTKQLESILAHELAHVRRHDYLVNMLQTVVETLGFYHPAVWWVSHKIRNEREDCCDDLAVDISSSRITYARALASMEEIRSARSELAVGATGGNLLRRIHRLVGKDSSNSSQANWIPSLIAMLLVAIITIPTAVALTGNSESREPGSETEASAGAQELDTLESNGSSDTPAAQVRCVGKVLDTEGQPIGGAKVSAYEIHFDGIAGNFMLHQAGRMTTAEDGEFTFTADPKPERSLFNRCYIVAVKQDLALGWTAWKMREDAQLIIELGEPERLEGVIVDEAGQPIAGAEVRANLYRTVEAGDGERNKEWVPGIALLDELGTRTNSQGRFLLGNLPSDLGVDLLVTAAGKAMTYTQRPDREPAFRTGQTDIRVVLPTEARIEGRILHDRTGKGIAQVKFAVVAEFSGLFCYRFVHTTDDDGGFSIGGLQTGRYLIRNGGFPNTHVDVKSGRTTKLAVQRMNRAQTHYFHVFLDHGSPVGLKPERKMVVRFENNEGVRDAGYIDVDGCLNVYLSQEEFRQWQLGKGWFTALVPNAGGKPVRQEEIFSYYDLTKVWPRNITAERPDSENSPNSLIDKTLPSLDQIGLNARSVQASGKELLVCFWDMDQRPSRNMVDELAKREKKLQAKGIVPVLVHTSDVEAAKLKEWLADFRIPFLCGTVKSDTEGNLSRWGVRAQPWLILTDKKAIVRAEGLSIEQLDERLEQEPVEAERAWGEPVEGVQIRLLDASAVWGRSDWPHPVVRLRLDARNEGGRYLHLPENGLSWQIEVDGVWYEWVDPRLFSATSADKGKATVSSGGRLLNFDPGDAHAELTVDIASDWRQIPDGKQEQFGRRRWTGWASIDDEYGPELILGPGPRRIRVAVTCPSSRAGVHTPVRLLSKPVEFAPLLQSDPASEDEPIKGPKQAGARADSVQGLSVATEGSEDKGHIRVDCLVLEIYGSTKLDRETTIAANNILGEMSPSGTSGRSAPTVEELIEKVTATTMSIGEHSSKTTGGRTMQKMIDLLVSRGCVKILMNPTIEVADGGKATVSSAQKIARGKAATPATQSDRYVDVTDYLQIAPHILDDGNIRLLAEGTIHRYLSRQDKESPPAIMNSSFSTQAVIEPGMSLITGGTKETQAGAKDFEEPQTELLFILTPMIAETTKPQDETDAGIEPGTEERERPTTVQDGRIHFPKNWREIAEQALDNPGDPLALDEEDAKVHTRLGRIVDLPGLSPGMSFEQVIKELERAAEPVLQIQPNWKDLRESANVERTTPVEMKPLTEVKLDKALEMLLASVSTDSAKVGYVVYEGVVVIATKKALPRNMVTRLYDISDLIGEPADHGGTSREMQVLNLVQLIQKRVEPKSWYDLDTEGKGTITPYPIQEPKKLAVYNTAEVHRQIEGLLEKIRSGAVSVPTEYPKQMTIRGRCIDSGGHAIRDARVVLYSLEDATWQVAESRTNSRANSGWDRSRR